MNRFDRVPCAERATIVMIATDRCLRIPPLHSFGRPAKHGSAAAPSAGGALPLDTLQGD
ncbi:MAG TPA: hypothetical protein VND64_06795 [Pirellulales bacterium]|nr:hypothetical protein [Pirellulales bacterium]